MTIKRIPVSFKFPVDVLTKLRAEAKRTGRSMTTIILRALSKNGKSV